MNAEAADAHLLQKNISDIFFFCLLLPHPLFLTDKNFSLFN